MNIAVGYSKDKLATRAVCGAFTKGVKAHGDTLTKIKTVTDLNKKDYDAALQYGEWNGGINKVRKAIHNLCKDHRTRKIIADLGLILTDRASANTNLDRYTYVGYDKFKGEANCYNEGSPSDRWDKLVKKGAEIKPWRKDGDHIVVFGQRADAASTKHCNYFNWLKKTLLNIRKYTDRPIIFRSHPITRLEDVPSIGIDNFLVSKFKNKSMEDILKGAWCSVTRTSNAGVDSILNGVPVVCPDPVCVAYDLCTHDIKDIDNPETPEREQFFYNLAYAQWSIPEIEKGDCWGHLRSHCIENIK